MPNYYAAKSDWDVQNDEENYHKHLEYKKRKEEGKLTFRDRIFGGLL